MKPSRIDNRQEDIFRGRLSSELNPKHEMMILSKMIPWNNLESEFSDLYQSERSAGGQPPKPIRFGTVANPHFLPFLNSTSPCKSRVQIFQKVDLRHGLKKVIVDTTVMPKNIEFPTDSKLFVLANFLF